MRVGSLFSGIGGLDLGLERAGMTVAWQSEIDPYASKVLAKHWPHVPNLGDITIIDWSTVERVDLICGGYPCQPFSLAGSRGGENDARHLWPDFAEALCVVRPRWALLENVPGHLSMGFGEVLADLADLGYDAEWDCVSARSVGAPHLRRRVFVVAHTKRPRLEGLRPERRLAQGHGEVETRRGRNGQNVADTNGTSGHITGGASQAVLRPTTVERSGRRSGGIGHSWAAEPDVGRVAHGVPSRVDRLKCLGNAVVPQVAEYVGRKIMEAAA